jgi:predicted phage terminase large subunit-like protein
MNVRVRLGPRKRVRLNDPILNGAAPAITSPSLGTDKLTPEALAYALPGGFAKLAYPKFMYNPFIRDVENKILDIAKGKAINVMFSAPPRHGKTLFIDRVLPAWYLGHFPDNRVLLVTYQDGFSRTQSRHARNIFKRLGQSVFGLDVADDTQAANQWDIKNHEGGMEAVGAGGAITGKGAHLLIIDDLIKGMEQALNETFLDGLWEWFLTDVMSRLEPGATVIIIMTRWTQSDVIGKITAQQEKDRENNLDEDDMGFADFQYYNYPALALEGDILGRSVGQALFPQRYDEKALRKIQNRNDDYWWEALYQGNPVPLKGNIIDVTGFKKKYKYDDPPKRSDFDMVIISTDTAIKDTEIADYTVFGVWGVMETGYYLLDIIRDKMTFPQLLDQAKGLNRVWRPEFFLIEDKGSGTSLIQQLREDMDVNVFPIDPGSESKVLRMQAETTTIKSGLIILPDDASWKDEFILECRSFPRGKKDQIDMFSQFLKFMRQTTSGIRMF